MIRAMLVLVLLGMCAFYFYQKQQTEVPSAPSVMVTLSESAVDGLKKALPAPVFEKEVRPFLDGGREKGLTARQTDDLMSQLEKIGKALGGSASSAVEKFIGELDPERGKREGSSVRQWVDKGVENARKSMPGWKSVAEDVINGLGSILSKLFDGAADLLQGK